MTQPTPVAVRPPVESPDIFGATDVGLKRAENQDSISWEPSPVPAKGRLLIVADGVGGQQDGAIASDMAARRTVALYYADPSPDVPTSLKRAIETANAEINEAGKQQTAATQMATTIVAAVLLGNRLYVAHVGDSRAYLMRGGKARPLTRDHSWVAEQVRAGVLTPVQARNHPQRNVIVRSLGSKANVQVDTSTIDLQPGDVVVLSSDGLHGLVNDEEIARLASTLPSAEAVRRLIQLANDRGGSDNISAIVVKMPGGRGAAVVPPLWALAGVGTALVLLIIAGLSILPLPPTILLPTPSPGVAVRTPVATIAAVSQATSAPAQPTTKGTSAVAGAAPASPTQPAAKNTSTSTPTNVPPTLEPTAMPSKTATQTPVVVPVVTPVVNLSKDCSEPPSSRIIGDPNPLAFSRPDVQSFSIPYTGNRTLDVFKPINVKGQKWSWYPFVWNGSCWYIAGNNLKR